jgi:hypothetical protein
MVTVKVGVFTNKKQTLKTFIEKGTPEGGRAARLQPPPPPSLKFKKHRFCIHDIKCCT